MSTAWTCQNGRARRAGRISFGDRLGSGGRGKPVSTSVRISAVVLAALLVAGACQSGGATTTPAATPTAIPSATQTLARHGVFSPTGRTSSTRPRGHTATLLANGKVLITGGYDSLDTIVASAELYKP